MSLTAVLTVHSPCHVVAECWLDRFILVICRSIEQADLIRDKGRHCLLEYFRLCPDLSLLFKGAKLGQIILRKIIEIVAI